MCGARLLLLPVAHTHTHTLTHWRSPLSSSLTPLMHCTLGRVWARPGHHPAIRDAVDCRRNALPKISDTQNASLWRNAPRLASCRVASVSLSPHNSCRQPRGQCVCVPCVQVCGRMPNRPWSLSAVVVSRTERHRTSFLSVHVQPLPPWTLWQTQPILLPPFSSPQSAAPQLRRYKHRWAAVFEPPPFPSHFPRPPFTPEACAPPCWLPLAPPVRTLSLCWAPWHPTADTSAAAAWCGPRDTQAKASRHQR